jgi:hypothetical protein
MQINLNAQLCRLELNGATRNYIIVLVKFYGGKVPSHLMKLPCSL